ncbi:hypothetical protein D3C80_1954490 [compost metagenome]
MTVRRKPRGPGQNLHTTGPKEFGVKMIVALSMIECQTTVAAPECDLRDIELSGRSRWGEIAAAVHRAPDADHADRVLIISDRKRASAACDAENPAVANGQTS